MAKDLSKTGSQGRLQQQRKQFMKTRNPLFTTILLMQACLGLSPGAQAVTPEPDGGYPGFNTAEGQNALFSRTTGLWNTALGGYTLYSDTTGRANTAVGLSALRLNVTGEFNTAVGVNALYFNDGDPSVGRGSRNSAFGSYALFSNTTGHDNCAFGWGALASNTNGEQNTAIGGGALGQANSTGTNTAIGFGALNENTTGNFNTAAGAGSLFLAVGSSNTAVGAGAGGSIVTGNNNVYIGQGMVGVGGESNACYIASIFGQTSVGGVQVFINSDNKLGTVTSSKRFKEEIEPIGEASEALFSLKPVSFHYKKEIDPAGTSQFGLVAEDVEKVNPDLVVRDKEGKPYSVRYDQVNAMLLNEFLKEHKTVHEQKAAIGVLQKEIASLNATVKEQAAQIQKVSAQIEMNNAPTRVVLNNQ
jgi:trimeric autotransporter adhesin